MDQQGNGSSERFELGPQGLPYLTKQVDRVRQYSLGLDKELGDLRAKVERLAQDVDKVADDDADDFLTLEKMVERVESRVAQLEQRTSIESDDREHKLVAWSFGAALVHLAAIIAAILISAVLV